MHFSYNPRQLKFFSLAAWVYAYLPCFIMHATHTNMCSQSVEDIVDFLKSQKLDAYIQTFRDNGIDGDILAAIVARKEKVKVGEKEVTVVDLILQEEFGMKTAMHRLRVKGKIKGFCDSLSIRSSSSSAVVASSKSSRK